MINTSPKYAAAITAATRKIVPLSIINLVDPDIVYGVTTSSGEITASKSEQIYDYVLEIDATPRVTLETNRWLLNGQFAFYGADNGEQGVISTGQSDKSGTMSGVWVQLNVSDISTLQACSIYFSGAEWDGFATEFKLDIYSGGSIVWTTTAKDVTGPVTVFEGFTVYDVTAIRVTPIKWSLPGRRMRAIEIIPGVYETWDGHTINSIDVMQQADFSCLSLPYGTAALTIRNETRRFDPTNKSGLFKSVEERQAIPIMLGVVIDGRPEYHAIGTYYQQVNGWSIDSDGITITWQLVDIIGLIAQRKYTPPAALPTTLAGWLASIVSQLGNNFAGRYIVDSALGATELTCALSDVDNATCGDVLRWVCQAAGAYPIADATTGYLSARTLDATATRTVDLKQQNAYPTISANEDIASITYRLAGGTQYVVGGTNAAAGLTVSVSNPFITRQAQAIAAARNILANYGGNKITARGRGDMANEIGDVNIVELVPGVDMSCRRYKQQYRYVDGVMTNTQAYFVQSTGATLYENYDILTEDGTWAVPDGVTEVQIIAIGGGAGGENGTDGTWSANGAGGAGGAGGKIWYGTVGVNAGQQLQVHIGAGGAAGTDGDATTVGTYSSANGQRYNGYAVATLGGAYGLNGLDGEIGPVGYYQRQLGRWSINVETYNGTAGRDNTGNGGNGGNGGIRGISGTDGEQTHIKRYPTDGGKGGQGGSGVAIISYDKP